MKKKETKNDIQKIVSQRKGPPPLVFAAILLLYILASAGVMRVAREQSAIVLFGSPAPISSFAGVLSAMANICIIFLVLFFSKAGLVTMIVIMVFQFPMLAMNIIVRHNPAAFSGMFSNIFAVVACIIIYVNNLRLERYQRRLRDQAATDRLTGLPNRFACAEYLESLIRGSKKFAVISIDLNNFKSVNDSMGREVGDKVLLELARRWSSLTVARRGKTLDFLARLGGDEYAVVVRGYDSQESLAAAVEAYKLELANKITIEGCDYLMDACFGYAEYPADASSAASILSCADAALKEAKGRGAGSNILKFEPKHIKTEKALAMERKIRAALEKDDVFFRLQPQYDARRKLRGFEALARMSDEDGSVINPVDFIPIAEKAGLVDRVDKRVYGLAAAFLSKLTRDRQSDAVLCVNVSGRHLMKTNFVDGLKSVLDKACFSPDRLELEISESVFMDSADKTLERVKQVKALGVRVAVDNFGSGGLSLNSLSKFPVDAIKLDKPFIDAIDSSDAAKKYAAAIISAGHILNLQIVAEGVERPEQVDALRAAGCDYIQGFVWGKPLPPDEASTLM